MRNFFCFLGLSLCLQACGNAQYVRHGANMPQSSYPSSPTVPANRGYSPEESLAEGDVVEERYEYDYGD